MKFSPSGVAAYGVSTVTVDGSVPAPLVGRSVGLPSWQSDTQLIYQDGGTGSGPWTLAQLTYPGLTTATLSATGANVTGGGNSIWAKYLGGGEGVTTSWGGPFAAAALATVSPDGQVVVIDDALTNIGLTVYDALGAVLYTLPSVVLADPRSVRLQDSILAYRDGSGWHLRDVTTGLIPPWYPRIDGVDVVVPIVVNGTLYVLEHATNLTLREAHRPKGWTLYSTPDAFNPDVVLLSGSTVRAGACTDVTESDTSLITFDVDVTNAGAVTSVAGTISGGAIVYAAPVTVAASVFPVDAQEGATLAPDSLIPERHPVVDAKRGDLITRPWLQWAQKIDASLGQVGGIVQDTSNPPVVPTSGFTEIDVTGQPPILSTPANTTFELSSADLSVAITTNPASNTVDLSVASAPATSIAVPPMLLVDDDPPEAMVIPGPQGIEGPAGATGPSGASLTQVIPGLDGEDGETFVIPGPIGETGATGATGASAPSQLILLATSEDESGELLSIPGPAGAAGTASVALSGLTDALAANTLANGDYAQVWQWALTTASKIGFKIAESAAASGGANELVHIETAASSTAVPLYVVNGGGEISFRVDDASGGDGTPFIIDRDGNVAIGKTNAQEKFNIYGGGSQYFESGSNNFFLKWNGTTFQQGSTTSNDLEFFVANTVRLTLKSAGTVLCGGPLQLKSGAFTDLPVSPATGMLQVVTDSTTATWGATITGTGGNTVLAFYNGSNWTVAAV